MSEMTDITKMNSLILTHVLYLCAAVPLTLWVARTLHANGRVFLLDAFRGNEALADSVNRLLVVGFYLVNVGFVLLYLKHGDHPAGVGGVMETVATKVGLVMLVLGGMHFCNIFIFNKLRRRALDRATPVPPVLPSARLASAPGA
jgi:hypothetical protein